MSSRLFDDFSPVSTEKWMEVVQRDLKGADFDKRLVTETLDQIKLRPFYRAEDVSSAADTIVRGYLRQPVRPAFREEIRETTIEEANRHVFRSLKRGASEVSVLAYPTGVPIDSPSDMAEFTKDIWIDAVSIHWMSGPLMRPMFGLLKNEAERRGMEIAALQGSIEFDPVMDRCLGWTSDSIANWKSEFEAGLDLLASAPQFNSVTIRGSMIEKAGASLAQELAFSLGLFTEYLAVVADRFDADGVRDFVRRTEFRLGIGTNYFLEIAKLRAMKLLVQNVLESFGITGVRPKFHAITTSSNKTLYDPFNNLLRATVEAMAATMGGVDSLSVAAYDQGYGAPDEFSEHLTRNTEALLLEEAYLGRVADPLGGSYLVEHLTQEYAAKGWELFREVESFGGFVAAWELGFISDGIKGVQAKRSKQVNSRRRTIVGTTVYPNPKERRLSDVRDHLVAHQVFVPRELGSLDLSTYLTDGKAPSTALDPFRPSWPFEHLRLRIERSVATGGHSPRILLAEFGNVKMRRARSMFVQGFLGAGGYDFQEVIVDSPTSLECKIAEYAPDAVVLCSEDGAYLDFAKALETTVPVIVAGNPVETVEELKTAGVADFIHIRLDQLTTLERYHQWFEVPEVPLGEPLVPLVPATDVVGGVVK